MATVRLVGGSQWMQLTHWRSLPSGGRNRSVIDRMTAYLEARIAGGEFRAVPDPATAARLIIESVTWFARHRHGDPDSGTIDDQRGCATVVDFVVGSLVPR